MGPHMEGAAGQRTEQQSGFNPESPSWSWAAFGDVSNWGLEKQT